MNFCSRKDMTKFQGLYEASKLGTFFILVIPRNSKSSQTAPCIFLIKLTKQRVILFYKLLLRILDHETFV